MSDITRLELELGLMRHRNGLRIAREWEELRDEERLDAEQMLTYTRQRKAREVAEYRRGVRAGKAAA